MAEPKAKQGPWIHVVTRQIGTAQMPGIETEAVVMAKLCEKFPEEEWELKNTHLLGYESSWAGVTFVFVRR